MHKLQKREIPIRRLMRPFWLSFPKKASPLSSLGTRVSYSDASFGTSGRVLLKAVCELKAEAAAIALQGILNVVTAGWIAVTSIAQIVDAGRKFEVLEQVLA